MFRITPRPQFPHRKQDSTSSVDKVKLYLEGSVSNVGHELLADNLLSTMAGSNSVKSEDFLGSSEEEVTGEGSGSVVIMSVEVNHGRQMFLV